MPLNKTAVGVVLAENKQLRARVEEQAALIRHLKSIHGGKAGGAEETVSREQRMAEALAVIAKLADNILAARPEGEAVFGAAAIFREIRARAECAMHPGNMMQGGDAQC